MLEPRKGGPAATSLGVQGPHRTPWRLCRVEVSPCGAGPPVQRGGTGKRGWGHKGCLPFPLPQRG